MPKSLSPMDIPIILSSEPSARVHLVDMMARPAMSPTSCHTETGTARALGQKVMDSASGILELMKQRRAAQASTGKFAKGTPSTGTASKSHERQMNSTESEEPVALRERLVFRKNVPIPADSFLFLQNSYRDAEAFINKSLVFDAEMTKLAREILGEAVLDCPDEDGILLRCALREVYEALVLCHNFETLIADFTIRRLKSQSQIAGITPEEVRQLDLLEEVWKAHGVPNGSEMGLLMEATGHGLQYLAGWCE